MNSNRFRCIMALYPKAFRARYQQELEDLVQRERLTVRTATNLVSGAISQHLQSPSDWLAAGGALWTTLASLWFWFFMQTGIACTSTLTTPSSCHPTSIAGSIGLWPTILLGLTVTVLLGLIILQFRHSRIFLWSFSLLIVAFFILSFGIDYPLLPTAALLMTAAILPRPKRPNIKAT